MKPSARPLFLSLLCLTSLPAAATAPPEPVALVYEVEGRAEKAVPGSSPRPVKLFDRLPARTTLNAAAGSRLALAFVTGKRYEIDGPAEATLGRADLSNRSGSVRPLPAVPPLPRLPAIAEEESPGSKAGAVRIRGGEIAVLSPAGGEAALADATVLRFESSRGAARYRIEIEDVRGTVVFRLETEVSTVEVPAGTLAPGSRYHWTVTALGQPGPVSRGDGDFRTLPRKTAEARARWRKAVAAMDGGHSRALLEAVDHALGLRSERPQGAATGVVVEDVAAELPAAKAGLETGDVILSWSCAAFPPALPQPASGRITSPYDLLALEIEEAPRRPVALRGRRGSAEMVWILAEGEWGLATRPGLTGRLAALYLEGTRKNEAGDLAAAELSWRTASSPASGACPISNLRKGKTPPSGRGAQDPLSRSVSGRVARPAGLHPSSCLDEGRNRTASSAPSSTRRIRSIVKRGRCSPRRTGRRG
jgi:hypothetical protein